jgi:hypothetical protein
VRGSRRSRAWLPQIKVETSPASWGVRCMAAVYYGALAATLNPKTAGAGGHRDARKRGRCAQGGAGPLVRGAPHRAQARPHGEPETACRTQGLCLLCSAVLLAAWPPRQCSAAWTSSMLHPSWPSPEQWLVAVLGGSHSPCSMPSGRGAGCMIPCAHLVLMWVLCEPKFCVQSDVAAM